MSATELTDRTPRRDDCSPRGRVTRSLLGWSAIAGPFYIVASVVEGVTRPGFDFARHDWSLLAIGPTGWIHAAVLVLTGAMVIAGAVGLVRAFRDAGRSAAAGILLGIYGAGLVGAGVFVADPVAGFPPGSTGGSISWHGLLHIAFGGIGFLALVACCIVVGVRFARERQPGWAAFSIVTGVVFLAGFSGVASGSAGGSVVVIAFTVAVVLSFAWLAALSIRLYRSTR